MFLIETIFYALYPIVVACLIITLPLRALEIDVHLQWLIVMALMWPIIRMLWRANSKVRTVGLSVAGVISLCTYVALGIEATPPFYDRTIHTVLPDGFSVEGFEQVQPGMSYREAATLVGIGPNPQELQFSSIERRPARPGDKAGEWTVYVVRFTTRGRVQYTTTYQRDLMIDDGKTVFEVRPTAGFSEAGFKLIREGMSYDEVRLLVGAGLASGDEYYGRRVKNGWPNYGHMVYRLRFDNGLVRDTYAMMRVD